MIYTTVVDNGDNTVMVKVQVNISLSLIRYYGWHLSVRQGCGYQISTVQDIA